MALCTFGQSLHRASSCASASGRTHTQRDGRLQVARGGRIANPLPFSAPARAPSCGVRLHAAKPETGSPTQSLDVENVSRDYCDDFQCTSSPAVEQTVKSVARDIQRIKYTPALFQPDVQYSDGFRSFTGYLKYKKLTWIRDILEKPRTEVLKLRMQDKGTAEVKWVLRGTIKAFEVEVPMDTTISMNLLTGRVEKHAEKWDLSRCSPPAAALLTLSRMAWALKTAGSDAGDDISRSVSSLSSLDEGSSDVYMNPQDPTRFFQGQDQNSGFSDLLSLATVAAALYFVYKAFEAIETLN